MGLSFLLRGVSKHMRRIPTAGGTCSQLLSPSSPVAPRTHYLSTQATAHNGASVLVRRLRCRALRSQSIRSTQSRHASSHRLWLASRFVSPGWDLGHLCLSQRPPCGGTGISKSHRTWSSQTWQPSCTLRRMVPSPHSSWWKAGIASADFHPGGLASTGMCSTIYTSTALPPQESQGKPGKATAGRTPRCTGHMMCSAHRPAWSSALGSLLQA